MSTSGIILIFVLFLFFSGLIVSAFVISKRRGGDGKSNGDTSTKATHACPHCKQIIKYTSNGVDLKLKCPACQCTVAIPSWM
jgi:hypothetical protein